MGVVSAMQPGVVSCSRSKYHRQFCCWLLMLIFLVLGSRADPVSFDDMEHDKMTTHNT